MKITSYLTSLKPLILTCKVLTYGTHNPAVPYHRMDVRAKTPAKTCKFRVYGCSLAKRKSCQCQTHSINLHLTCSIDPQRAPCPTWSTERMDEADVLVRPTRISPRQSGAAGPRSTRPFGGARRGPDRVGYVLQSSAAPTGPSS